MSKKAGVLAVGLILLSACSRGTSESILAAGVVDGEVVTVKSSVSGKIVTLDILEGADVEKNHVLMTVESDKIENQIQGLEIQEKGLDVNRKKLDSKLQVLSANMEYWEGQVGSFERLEKKESVSGDQLEQARLKLDEAKDSLYEARQSLRELSVRSEEVKNRKEYFRLLLEDYVVTSPVFGFVLEKFVSQGETVFPGTPVADILDWSSLYVETFLEETEISRLEFGQKTDILVDGMEGRVFSGTITYFGQKAEFSPKYIISDKERQSLLYRVKIKLEENLKVFKLGMPVTVRIGPA
jgi:HlyD family secretion protein